jgi:hypothetical protein
MASSSFVGWDISFTIWWEPRNPNVIKMCTGDPRFVNADFHAGRPTQPHVRGWRHVWRSDLVDQRTGGAIVPE